MERVSLKEVDHDVSFLQIVPSGNRVTNHQSPGDCLLFSHFRPRQEPNPSKKDQRTTATEEKQKGCMADLLGFKFPRKSRHVGFRHRAPREVSDTTLDELTTAEALLFLSVSEPQAKKQKHLKDSTTDLLGFHVPKKSRHVGFEPLETEGNLVPEEASETIDEKTAAEILLSLSVAESIEPPAMKQNNLKGSFKIKLVHGSRSDDHKKRNQPVISPPQSRRENPKALVNLLSEKRGKKLDLVVIKKLTKSDLDKYQGRFSMPKCRVNENFLEKEEKKKLDDGEAVAVTLTVLDSSLKECNLMLKKWKMNKTFSYTLIDGWWNEVVQGREKELRVDVEVKLWSFRCDSRLCLALLAVPPADG